MSLKVRLTLWYLGALALLLTVFAMSIYWQSRNNLLSQMDDTLRLAAAQSVNNVSLSDPPSFLSTDTLQRSLNQINNNLIVQLVSGDGQVLTRLQNAESEEDESEGEEQLPLVQPSNQAVVVGQFDQNWRVHSERLQDGIWIQTAQGLDAVEDSLSTLLRQIFFGLPIALSLAGGVGYFLANQALSPVDRVTKTAQAISATDLAQRINYEGPPDEVGRLAMTFDEMLDRLEEAFNRERQFTSDAAHELRTPLTAIKGNIEVALGQPRSEDEYMSVLETVEKEVERLIKMSRALLFMARLDNKQISDDLDLIDLQDFIPGLLDFMTPLANEKSIEIVSNIEPLTVKAYPDLLIQALLNVIDNAIKYSPRNSKLFLEVYLAETNEIAIAITDNGDGIPSEQLAYLFDRFYRVNQSRSRQNEAGGAGLGLAIVKQIVEVMGGNISVNSQIGEGTQFVMRFPQPHEA